MIKPKLMDDALLTDIQRARADTGSFHLWWLGQSGFLVQWQGEHLLLDPYLSDSLTKKYADTDRPHVRMTRLAVKPARLNVIDVVSSSHNHTDHLDGETLTALRRANPKMRIIVPEANRRFAAERLGVDPGELLGCNDGATTAVGVFHLHGVPAAHETIERDESGRCKFLGYVVRFGPWTVYHSGDTVLYDGMVERLRRYEIDVALLPINGRSPDRGVPGNLWGREAARLAQDIAARLVIPCHFDMFEFNTATPVELSAAAQKIGQPCQVLQCGERWSSSVL